MGNLSRKAALGMAAVLTAVTAATAVAGVAGAAPGSRAVPVALAAPAAPASTAGLTAATAPVTPAAASWTSDRYWPIVQHGDRSVKVVDVQCLLRQWLGVWLPCDTRFNEETERYVKLFQREHGLYPSGKVGPETWARLIISVGDGSRHHWAVLAAQATLRMAYWYPITIDGVFGPKTLAAVESFQKKYDLKPDGIVGPLTWSTMLHFEW